MRGERHFFVVKDKNWVKMNQYSNTNKFISSRQIWSLCCVHIIIWQNKNNFHFSRYKCLFYNGGFNRRRSSPVWTFYRNYKQDYQHNCFSDQCNNIRWFKDPIKIHNTECWMLLNCLDLHFYKWMGPWDLKFMALISTKI